MNRQQLVMAIGALLFAACGGGRTVGNQAQYEDLCSVEQTGTKQFALDDNTSNNISFLQYIPGDTLARLSLLNTHSNSIYLYDATSGNLLTSIPFDLEGANGVGQIQGYRYHNNDSIFVYPYGAGRVYLANSQGKVKEVYPLYEGVTIEENEDSIMANPKFFPTDPYVDTANPMFYSNGKIFMAQGFFAETTLEREDNTSVNLSYDIATRTTEFSMPYSETYRKHDWGGNFFYRHPSVAMTADGKQLFSYSADSNLWLYDPATGQRDSLYAGSLEIKEVIIYELTLPTLFRTIPNFTI